MSNNLPQVQSVSTQAMVFDPAVISGMQAMAQVMCASKITIPKHLQGSSGDCLAIIMQAAQWGMNPYAVAQKTHIVNGTLGYEAQLVNAVISASSLLVDRPQYSFDGDWKGVNGKTDNSESRAVTVTAQLVNEDAPRTLRVAMSQVGSVRNSPLWTADPRQQLAYLAIKRWARLYVPDVLLGVYSADELRDNAPTEKDMGDIITDQPVSRAEQIKARLADKRKAKPDVPVIGIDDVLQSIAMAEDMAALKAASAAASHLSDEEKTTARAAYRTRAKAIETAAQAAAEPAGELAPSMTYAQVMDALQNAKTIDALNDAAGLIGLVEDEQQRGELAAKYDALLGQF